MLATEIKKGYAPQIGSNEDTDKNLNQSFISESDDDEDEDVDEDNEEENNDINYTISTGNTGLVVVNNMIDYINRGDELSNMCLYEYTEKVYKKKFTDDDVKENEKVLKKIADEKNNANKKRYNFNAKKKSGTKARPKYYFKPEHPQSETHWQVVRKDENKLVPALSKLPPNKNTDKLQHQKCMLLLFKPFRSYNDQDNQPIYNGNSWDETYETACFSPPYCDYSENIQEMHIGLQEREESRNEDGDTATNDVVDESEEIDLDQPIDVIEKGVDPMTTDALNIIETRTGWLQESLTNQANHQVPENERRMQPNAQWKKDIERQNEARLNGDENEDENDPLPLPSVSVSGAVSHVDVGFSVQTVDDKNLDEIADDIAEEYS